MVKQELNLEEIILKPILKPTLEEGILKPNLKPQISKIKKKNPNLPATAEQKSNNPDLPRLGLHARSQAYKSQVPRVKRRALHDGSE